MFADLTWERKQLHCRIFWTR